jgi:hypothetical protein
VFAGGTDGSSGSRRHRALAEGILASLLKLLDLALKLRDQFVAAVNLGDQSRRSFPVSGHEHQQAGAPAASPIASPDHPRSASLSPAFRAELNIPMMAHAFAKNAALPEFLR